MITLHCGNVTDDYHFLAAHMQQDLSVRTFTWAVIASCSQYLGLISYLHLSSPYSQHQSHGLYFLLLTIQRLLSCADVTAVLPVW